MNESVDAGRESGTKMIEVADRSAYRQRMNDLLMLDPATTAVVTVDMQRDYLDLEVASSPLSTSEADRVVSGCSRTLALARSVGIPVVHAYVAKSMVEFESGVFGNPLSRMSTRAGISQNVSAGVRQIPDRIEGSPQAQVPPDLVEPSDLHVTSKRTNDACFGTNLTLILERVFACETVLLLGVNTDSCVYSTAFSLANHGYNTVIVEDGVGSTRGTDHHLMAIELMSRTFAWVMDVETLAGKLQPERAGAATAADVHHANA